MKRQKVKKIAAVISAAILAMCTIYGTAYASDTRSVEYGDYPNEYEELFERMTDEDYEYLARCAMCEAGYSNIVCMEGTICVILNRVISERWTPDTVKDVVNQRGQFVTKPKFFRGTPNELTYAGIENVKKHGAKVIRDELAMQGWDFASTDYDCFATKKQSQAECHIWIGLRDENGRPIKGQGHWLGILKRK